MKYYKKEIDNFDYSKKYNPKEHRFDFLKDKEEAKKFEEGNHKKRTYEVAKNVFKTAEELIKPTKGDIRQSSSEITGQANINPDAKLPEAHYIDE